MFSFRKKVEMPSADEALPGRATAIPTARTHFVNGHALKGPYPDGLAMAMFGFGCFWGAERKFWELGDAVYVTAAGYAGGLTPNPTYEEVCSGRTGHNEVVLVVYDPKKISYEQLLKTFWESHDPTQGMRQGNDVGTQYRSGIYVFSPEQRGAAEASKAAYAKALGADVHLLVAGNGCGPVAEAGAKIDGVAKVLLAENPSYEHMLAEPVAALTLSAAFSRTRCRTSSASR